MYRATISGSQETASAIAAASRDKRTDADQPASGKNNCAGTGKEIV
jgi:hypothetical protein